MTRVMPDKLASAYIFIVLIFIALPFKMSMLNIMVTLVALFGIIHVIQSPHVVYSQLRANHFLLLFLLIWVPVLISAFDSIDKSDSWKVVGNILRFLFVGIFCISLSQVQINKITRIMTGVLLFVCFDALIQWITGYSLWGRQVDSTRITGVFGSKFHLGYVVGTLAPILLMYIARACFSEQSIRKRVIAGLLFFLIALTVLVSGTRSGWISFFFSCLLVLGWLIKQSYIRKTVIIYLMLVSMLALGAVSQLPIVKHRYQQSVAVFSEGYSWFDRVTSYRTTMWKVAYKEFKKHPVNGIGAGAFQTAFDQVPVEEKGYFTAALLVHLHGLEVLTETGIIGFIGYIWFCLTVLWLIFREDESPEWLMVAFIALMPINTHMSIYSSFWSPFIWVALALGLVSRHKVKTGLK